MTAEQLAFDLPPDIQIIPTRSDIRRGGTRLAHCWHCGLLVAAPDGVAGPYRATDPLGVCPRCGTREWGSATVPLGPFKGVDPDDPRCPSCRR